MAFVSGKNIVIVGQQPWDTVIGSNCKDIALEFSKSNRVLYVNSPLDRITAIRQGGDSKVQKRKRVIAGKQSGLEEISPNLWNLFPDCMVESVNWLNQKFLFDKVNRYNNIRFASSIRKALSILGFDRFYLFNDNEIIKCLHLIDLLKPELSIYYSRDYILATPYWAKHGKRLEPQVIASNDVCVANSMYLMDYCKRYNANSHYVGQGCDLDNFSVLENVLTPEPLKGIQTPIIGYVGALQSIRLDISLIEHIAVSRPDWTIVLVGPEDDVFAQSKLHHMHNVVFLGFKPMSELPNYIRSFDVCINPQLVNPLTEGNYPRKIDEYLAMGKPVVATATRAMEVFHDYVYLGNSGESYVSLIAQALAEDTLEAKSARQSFAAQHTWENSVAQIYEAIEASLENKILIEK